MLPHNKLSQPSKENKNPISSGVKNQQTEARVTVGHRTRHCSFRKLQLKSQELHLEVLWFQSYDQIDHTLCSFVPRHQEVLWWMANWLRFQFTSNSHGQISVWRFFFASNSLSNLISSPTSVSLFLYFCYFPHLSFPLCVCVCERKREVFSGTSIFASEWMVVCLSPYISLYKFLFHLTLIKRSDLFIRRTWCIKKRSISWGKGK